MTNRNDNRPMNGAIDQEIFETVIRDNLSPIGIATIIATLQPATMKQAPTEEPRRGLLELEWFANTLLDLLGPDEYARLLDEHCL